MQIFCTLAGASFRPAEAKDILRELQPGDCVTLEPEPENPYDDHAIQVLYDDVHLGFIPKTDNRAIFDLLSSGEEYQAEVIGHETWLKPMLEITLPNV